MSWVVIAFVGAVANVLVAEIFGWLSSIAESIVRRASRFLPGPAQERYREEWLAELEVLPGHGITAIIFALRVFSRAPMVAREITGQTRPKRAQFALKHGFDRPSAALLLFLFAPVMLLAAIAVKLTSGGPTLFAQPRVGRDGRVFDVYKFRSMRNAARSREVREPTALKFLLMEDIDPDGVGEACRRTAVGRFLRRTSLDELPQLFNVLRGDISLVGPRPERPEFVELFRKDVNG